MLADGPLCGCGNRGCAEALTKAEALARLGGRATAEEVYAGAGAGDERCLEAVQTVAGYLGIALANVVAVLGPDRIVIGGGISTAGELLLGPIRTALRARVTLVPGDEIEVVSRRRWVPSPAPSARPFGAPPSKYGAFERPGPPLG